MTRKMLDSVTPRNIPVDTPVVAGYLNGRYAWSQADWDRFPNSVHVKISVRASYVGVPGNRPHVLDVEPGDATPAESVDWVRAMRSLGTDPSVYCNRSTLGLVKLAFAARGVAEPHYWVATASGSPELYPGSVASQYLLDTDGVDYGVAADFWPGVDTVQPHLEDQETVSGKEVMPNVTVPKNADGTDNKRSIRVENLTGSSTTGIIIRPKAMNKVGDAPAPVFLYQLYAWSSYKQGVGHNPADVPGYNPRLSTAVKFDLPGALWCDLEYTCADDFDYQVVA